MKTVTALSIAGSDSGGGAGVQADLAAFSYFSTFGTTAITAVTAQNPTGVFAVAPIPAECVQAQIEAVLSCFTVKAAKTGMLFGTEIIAAVAHVLRKYPDVPMVVDPVMVATSGARLLKGDAIEALIAEILPRAALITPNIPEALLLANRQKEPRGAGEMAVHDLCRNLYCRFGVPVLLKGGHDKGQFATDILCTDRGLTAFQAPRETTLTTHGTGCSLSAAVTANIAHGMPLAEAIRYAKAYVLGRLRSAKPVGTGIWALCPPDRLPLEAVEVTRI